uniref:Uncharacterized protein n=1 Tax=Anguilla anguilla TaxID=7936 RepID=A0A0E9UW25_ANGAN
MGLFPFKRSGFLSAQLCTVVLPLHAPKCVVAIIIGLLFHRTPSF